MGLQTVKSNELAAKVAEAVSNGYAKSEPFTPLAAGTYPAKVTGHGILTWEAKDNRKAGVSACITCDVAGKSVSVLMSETDAASYNVKQAITIVSDGKYAKIGSAVTEKANVSTARKAKANA